MPLPQDTLVLTRKQQSDGDRTGFEVACREQELMKATNTKAKRNKTLKITEAALNQFWRTKFYISARVLCVCVYDQNYALVIVTQPKREEFTNTFARISQCEYLIQIYKTIVSETKQFWRTEILHNC